MPLSRPTAAASPHPVTPHLVRHARLPTPPAPRLLPLAAPLFVEMLLGMAMGLLGTALAARLGDASGAAFALCGELSAMLFVLFRVVGAGVSVVVSQALGGGRRDEAHRTARASLGAATWLGLICLVLAAAAAGPMLRLMNTPPEVLPLAVPLLRWLAITLLLDAWNATLGSVLRAHLQARTLLAITVTTQLTMLAMLLPAMHGAGTWPGWGLAGYPIALLASQVLGLALLLAAWRLQLGLVPMLCDWWRWPRHTLAPVLHIGLPAAGENIAWRAGFVFSIAVVGQMGTAALATHAYVMQIVGLVLLFGMVTGLSAEIVVGHMVGAGRLHEAHQLVQRVLARGLAVSLAAALAAASVGPWLLRCFTQDLHIITLGSQVLWLLLVLETGRTFNLVLINALRATGDASFPLRAGLGSFVLVLGAGSWWLGGRYGLLGVFIAYVADEWLRGLISWARWSRLGWLGAARRMHRRLRRLPVQAIR